MMLLKKCTAIKFWAWGALIAHLLIGSAFAGTQAGTVVNLNGPLLAKKADGTVKVLSQQSVVEQGDLLVTEKNTYARVKFIDNSEITLSPNTQFKIDSFAFESDKKEKDSALFSLIKGGLRSVTGLLGKRSKERFGLNTPTATIGIRGTTFVVEYVEPDPAVAVAYARASVAAAGDGAMPIEPLKLAQAINPNKLGGRAPGLYLQVLDGMVNLSNTGGSLNFAAGQFGFVPGQQMPPVILPNNPGMQFSPPPVFNSSTPNGGSVGPSGKNGGVDCEVR